MVANYPAHPYNSRHCLVCCITANSDIKLRFNIYWRGMEQSGSSSGS
ncbi:hypothetical protein P20495_1025 [Pseudoalteromonas sp. BSi20495]|nr:hypothetical protein P20495_1025 [Pseudoalteromonas sp. BSi20495]